MPVVTRYKKWGGKKAYVPRPVEWDLNGAAGVNTAGVWRAKCVRGFAVKADGRRRRGGWNRHNRIRNAKGRAQKFQSMYVQGSAEQKQDIQNTKSPLTYQKIKWRIKHLWEKAVSSVLQSSFTEMSKDWGGLQLSRPMTDSRANGSLTGVTVGISNPILFPGSRKCYTNPWRCTTFPSFLPPLSTCHYQP